MRRSLPLLLLTLTLAGCSNTTKQNLALLGTILRTPGPIQGQVLSGFQPLAGAQVSLLAAGTTGYASESASLLTASVLTNSPANSGVDNTTDTPTYFVTTDANGKFSLTAGDTPDYACTPGTQLYLTVNSPETRATFLAIVGECPTTGAFPHASKGILNLPLDEASTTAATYALSGFALNATHIGAPASDTQSLAKAFASATR